MLSENKNGIIFLYNGEYGVSTDENGLYYMRARYYNPEIKRFINQDVLIGTITDSPTLNRYAYVEGNPISLADPFGLSPAINWHTPLNWIGLLTFVPGLQPIGIAANAINAYLYFEEGNTFQGICSALSALPGLGTAIGNIGKAGSKLSTATGIISKFLHTTSNVGFIATGSYTIGSMLKYNYDHYIEGNENYTWKNALNDFVNGTFAVLSIYGGAKGLGWDKIEVPTTVKGSVDFGIFGSKKGSGLVDPNEIRFSQSSVNGSGELIESMTANGWKGEPIDIVRMPDGIYTTIDNTRVVAARQVGIKVQANVHSFDDILPLEYVERFTTKNGVPVTWGDAVEFRIKNQNSQFRNNYPYGSYEMFKIN